MEVDEHRVTAKFVVFPVYTLDIIFGMDFLAENVLIILRLDGIISPWSGFPDPKQSDDDATPVRLASDRVSLFHRGAVLVAEKTAAYPHASSELQNVT